MSFSVMKLVPPSVTGDRGKSIPLHCRGTPVSAIKRTYCGVNAFFPKFGGWYASIFTSTLGCC